MIARKIIDKYRTWIQDYITENLAANSEEIFLALLDHYSKAYPFISSHVSNSATLFKPSEGAKLAKSLHHAGEKRNAIMQAYQYLESFENPKTSELIPRTKKDDFFGLLIAYYYYFEDLETHIVPQAYEPLYQQILVLVHYYREESANIRADELIRKMSEHPIYVNCFDLIVELIPESKYVLFGKALFEIIINRKGGSISFGSYIAGIKFLDKDQINEIIIKAIKSVSGEKTATYQEGVMALATLPIPEDKCELVVRALLENKVRAERIGNDILTALKNIIISGWRFPENLLQNTISSLIAILKDKNQHFHYTNIPSALDVLAVINIPTNRLYEVVTAVCESSCWKQFRLEAFHLLEKIISEDERSRLIEQALKLIESCDPDKVHCAICVSKELSIPSDKMEVITSKLSQLNPALNQVPSRYKSNWERILAGIEDENSRYLDEKFQYFRYCNSDNDKPKRAEELAMHIIFDDVIQNLEAKNILLLRLYQIIPPERRMIMVAKLEHRINFTLLDAPSFTPYIQHLFIQKLQRIDAALSSLSGGLLPRDVVKEIVKLVN